ncbi:MAG TPA: hypothetical protein VEE83_03980 [Thermoplasmata archaeon]|nr:hypothetical protein [Thermoplasmata archaeon]
MTSPMPAKPSSKGRTKATACAEYWFRQRFHVPAEWAFRWCIDFSAYDWMHSGGTGSRAVTWLAPHTVILDDAFPAPGGRRVRKVKMVQVYPETKSWVSTHIVGPRHHSQFRYVIEAHGKNASSLRFQGRELRWDGPRLTPAQNRQLASELRAEDSALWERFAEEMERDYRSA